MAGQRRGPWSNTEDAYLMQLVQTHGPLNWVRISQTLGSRTPKQCRERYHQNLKPTLNHDPITPEEGVQIERMVQEMGKRWAEIARRLNGRSDNAVKNWWNGSQNRRKRLDRRRGTVQGTPTGGSLSGTWDDEYIRPMAGITSRPSLPLPRASGRPLSPINAQRYSLSSWGTEMPLPSPCSSESAPESEYGSNYTTSPAGSSRPLYNPIELPPLRSWQPSIQSDGSLGRLPSLSSLASADQPRRVGRVESQPHLPPLGGQPQLPTAPSSPVQQAPLYTAEAKQETRSKARDSVMNVRALLE